MPRHRKSGRIGIPTLRQNAMSTTSWAMMPRVAKPASVTIMGVVHAETSVWLPPKITMNAAKPAIDTTLLTTGAHAYGPKTLRALRISPSRANMP